MATPLRGVTAELHRHVNALVSDFAAEYGEVDLVGRRTDCSIREYDALSETFDRFGVVGGAGIRVIDDEQLLLVRYDRSEGWVDPGDSRRPGESYTDCAKRGVRESTGVEAAIDGLAQIQLIYLDDPTTRPAVPNPYVSFVGSVKSERAQPKDGVAAVRWMSDCPDELLYEELSEFSLPDC